MAARVGSARSRKSMGSSDTSPVSRAPGILAMSSVVPVSGAQGPGSSRPRVNPLISRFRSKEHSENYKPKPGCFSRFRKWMGGKQNLIEASAYAIFLCVFTAVLFQSQGTNELNFRTTEAIESMFLNTEWNNIETPGAIFDYLQSTALPTLIQKVDYNGVALPDNKLRYISDDYRILGGMAIRQVRIKSDSCEIFGDLANFFESCYGPWDEDFEETGDYGPSDAPFKWSSAEDNSENAFRGRLMSYPGSGYREIVPIDKDRAINDLLLTRLKPNKWIDQATRAVFLDATLYNPSRDTLVVLKMIFETPSSGGVVPSLNLRLLKGEHLFFRPSTARDLGIEGLMLFLLLCYMLLELRRWHKRGSAKYFSSAWAYYDWFNFAIFVVAYAARFQALTLAGELNFPPPDGEFVNMERPGFLIIQWKNMMALNAFVSWFKMFKYLQHIPFMAHLLKVLSRAAPDAASFLVCFFFVYTGAALAHLLAYGDTLAEFRTMGLCYYTLYRQILGDFNFMDMYDANRLIGPVFFVVWTVLGLLVLLNVFVSIILEAYEEVKEESEKVTFPQFTKTQVIDPIKKMLAARKSKAAVDPLTLAVDRQLKRHTRHESENSKSGEGNDTPSDTRQSARLKQNDTSDDEGDGGIIGAGASRRKLTSPSDSRTTPMLDSKHAIKAHSIVSRAGDEFLPPIGAAAVRGERLPATNSNGAMMSLPGASQAITFDSDQIADVLENTSHIHSRIEGLESQIEVMNRRLDELLNMQEDSSLRTATALESLTKGINALLDTEADDLE